MNKRRKYCNRSDFLLEKYSIIEEHGKYSGRLCQNQSYSQKKSHDLYPEKERERRANGYNYLISEIDILVNKDFRR